jgi:hypothetical protein
MGVHTGGSMMAGVDDSALAALMAEVDEPALQRKVLSLGRWLPRGPIDTWPSGKPWSWRPLAAVVALVWKQKQGASSHLSRTRREQQRSGTSSGDDPQHQRVMLPAA